MSMRRSLSLFILIVASSALGAAISLVLVTTYLHDTTVGLEKGLQSVRLAQEMQIDLLTYIRTSDEFLRTRVENDLRMKLLEARQYAGTREETELLADAERLIEGHFARIRQSGNLANETVDLQQAFGRLRRLVDLNVEQAEESMRRVKFLRKTMS
jgi:two-component system, OmpR family, sensor histidine kinase MtrB